MRTRLRKQLLWYDGEGKEMAREGADAAGGEHEAADYVPRRRGWTYINSRRSSRPSREGDAHRRRRTGPITPRRRRSDLTREYYQRRRRTGGSVAKKPTTDCSKGTRTRCYACCKRVAP